MRSVTLDGTWKLYYFLQTDVTIDQPADLQVYGINAIDAAVPGNVELDLMKEGRLPDLYFGDNIHKLKEYELYEWWYEKSFPTPGGIDGKKVELVFHGVDCLAEYWLNGVKIGQSENMLIEHVFNVNGMLKENGANTLFVRLRSPIIEAMKKEYEPSVYALPTNWEQLWIRKAPHSYGWDIMPRALSAGIWRRVELVVHEKNEIKDIYFHTVSANSKEAKLQVNFQLDLEPGLIRNAEIRVHGQCGDSVFDTVGKIRFSAGRLEINVAAPKLWWPRGYGQPDLYAIETQLVADGQVLASRCDRIGIRTVELLRTEVTSIERPGEFVFILNGLKIFCKGSNWVPADAFHSRDAGRYEAMLELFSDLNCNILRCWGGNVYEDHAFYSLCDQHGIMVWQDFAMACAVHPQDPGFHDAIRQEAVSVVKKLRNHPSIVLWSGDNECDWSYLWAGGLDPADNRITRSVLPDVVRRYDPYRPYLPSSPYMSPEAVREIVRKDNRSLMPEDHLWGPRDYFKGEFYSGSSAHFVSETGYHGCPNLSSVKRFIDEQHLWPWQNNTQWITHASDSVGEDGRYAYRIKLMADQIKELFGSKPDKLEDFILASQISQAEAFKYFIERIKLKKWDATGIIWWNMIDGWPQFSDAVVDYYFGKKLAYYYIKRIQQPVCIMISEPGAWHVSVVAGNDSGEDAEGSCRIWDADSGEILLEGRFVTRANSNAEVGKIRVSHGDKRLFLMEWDTNGKKYGNHYMLGHPPFSLEQYKAWLEKIAALPDSFDAAQIGG